MSNNPHDPDSAGRPLNQNNRMSDDPVDGGRRSDTLGRDGEWAAANPNEDGEQDQSTIEAFGEEGAGIAPKE